MPTDRLLLSVESNDTSNALHGVRKGRRTRNHAVDDRLAVFGFTGLKVRRVHAGLDEIAFRIDAKQAQPLAGNLPADDKRCVEADLVFLHIFTVAPLNVSHCIRYQHRSIEHGLRAPQIIIHASRATLVQHTDHSLCSGKLSGTQQYDDAVAATLEYRHLAELRKVIDAGIRARVRRKNQSLVE